jgi:peptidoglycan DL-endopeptidase CwlO
MMLAAMLAVALLAASPALAQDEPAVVADTKAKEAKAGGATAEAECKDGYIISKAGGVVAKAPCEPEPPKAAPAPAPPPPKAAPAPAAPAPAPAAPAPAPAPAEKALPPSGGISTPGLIALGAGALLVGGGLLARRLVR